MVTAPAAAGFYCPLPRAAHPLAALAQEGTDAWVRRFALATGEEERARTAAIRTGELAAFTVPDCSPEWLRVVADTASWLLAFDDECDDGPHRALPAELGETMWRIQQAIDFPDQPLGTTNRFAVALRDIRVRLDDLLPPVAVQRFVDGIRTFLMTELVKTGRAARGVVPGLEDHLATRSHNAAAMVFPLLWGAAGCTDPHTDLFADRRFRALMDLTATLVHWDDDLYSYARDRVDPGNGHNVVTLIRARLGGPEHQAVSEAVAQRDHMMGLFLVHRDRLADRASPDEHRFLIALGHYIRGNLEWHHTSHRYTGVDPADPLAPFLPRGLTETPGRAAPRIAAVARRWEGVA